MISLKENGAFGIVVDMALTEIQGLRALYLDVKLGVSHATRVGVWKGQVTQVGFVFFGKFGVVGIDQLRNKNAHSFNETTQNERTAVLPPWPVQTRGRK